jgi:hypothetical protein
LKKPGALQHNLETAQRSGDVGAWNKPEKAKEWRERLAQMEDFEE